MSNDLNNVGVHNKFKEIHVEEPQSGQHIKNL